MDKGSSSGGGIGCVGVLLIVFVVLKLTGLIHWSWIWVLSPLWISVGLVVVVLLGLLLVSIVLAGVNPRRK